MQERTNCRVDVSIVIPTCNEGEWLRRTAESILGAKTNLRYEILIVDDCCTDGSVDALTGMERIKILSMGGERLGLIHGKNAAVKEAEGRYLCFLDSHVLVHDYWIDYLRETCDAFPDGALVSGNLPDVNQFAPYNTLPRQQHGYTILNSRLDAGWYFHNRDYISKPYFQPLTPGGLMFMNAQYFAHLGGFASALRKWGAEDIEISLRNYYLGGENVVDPRVSVYHYYKKPGSNKWVTREQLAFNCLYTASIYFPYEYYASIQRSLVRTRWIVPPFVVDIESSKHKLLAEQLRFRFVRGFESWIMQFPAELRNFLNDTEINIRRALAWESGSAPKEHRDGLLRFFEKYLSAWKA